MEEDFFSVKDVDLNTLKYLDRLNLKSKLNSLVDIDFSLAETLMTEKVNSAQTFEDTIKVSREVMEFIKEQQQEEQNQQVEENSSGDDKQDPEEQVQQSNDTQISVSTEEKSTDDVAESDESNGQPSGQPEDETKDETKDEIDYSSDTDRSMRKNESKMIHNDSTTTHIRVTKEQLYKYFLFTEEDMLSSANFAEEKYSFYRDYNNEKEKFSVEYSTFIKDVKPAVNAMVQQFELRKSAMESKKIRESTSGSIDVNKLWQYKLDDRIFKTVMTVPDAKNHGLLMYIDYSSSMGSRIYETLKQSIILSMFAKRVGIPFELYGFTTNTIKFHDIYNSENRKDIEAHEAESNYYDYKSWAVKLVKIADSKWSKSKMHEMFERAMFSSKKPSNGFSAPFTEPAFRLGGTPLNETISVAHIMADDFVKRNNIQKMNIVFLTDGDAQDMRLSDDLDNWAKVIVWDIEGIGKIELTDAHNRYIYSDNRRIQAKKILLESLRKKYNVIGFFLTDRRNQVDANGYHVYKKYGGYDSFITVHDKRLQAVDDEFVTTVDDNVPQTNRKRMNVIKRDFKKFQKNKKMNKLIAQEFARLVS
jgi:hypothetical protein